MRKDLQKIQKEIDEVEKQDALFEGKNGFASYIQTSNMHKANLKRKFARRSRQVPFGENTFLELRDYRMPNIIDRFLHRLPNKIKIHLWLDAEQEQWGSIRICPLCGFSQWTIYPRKFNEWKFAPIYYDPEQLMKFIKEFKGVQ